MHKYLIIYLRDDSLCNQTIEAENKEKAFTEWNTYHCEWNYHRYAVQNIIRLDEE